MSGYLPGHNLYDQLRDLEQSNAELLAALEALTEWGCTYTSPRDANSPHELLIQARAAIAKAKGQ